MRGEEAEGSGSGAQSSRLLCALPVRRSVPAKSWSPPFYADHNSQTGAGLGNTGPGGAG